MIIRHITKFDYNIIYSMLRNYRDSGLIKNLDDCNNESHIATLLDYIRAGAGVGFIAENGDDSLGILLALKTPYVWNPETFVMNELCFWVEPDFRRTSAGYKLILRYVEYCQAMRSANAIRNFTMVQRAGTNLDYARFGFELAEESWSQ